MTREARDFAAELARRASLRDKALDGWAEAQHPRGQPENAGEFASGAGGAGAKSKPAEAAPEKKQKAASSLLEHALRKHINIEGFMAAQPKAVGMAIRKTEQNLAQSPSTNALVSAGGFKREDGTYTPERQAVHAEIVRKFLSPEAVAAARPAPGEKPTMTVLGGRGGSGKSWFMGPNGTVDAGKNIVLDNDKIKSMLPGYEGWNAALYHEEASDIFQTIDTLVREAGLNIVRDATMKSYRPTQDAVNAYRDRGYKVNGYYMFAPPHVAAQRAINRFMKDGSGKYGRYVPPSYVLGSTSNESSFDELTPSLDSWAVYDNSGDTGGQPKLVAKSGQSEKTK